MVHTRHIWIISNVVRRMLSINRTNRTIEYEYQKSRFSSALKEKTWKTQRLLQLNYKTTDLATTNWIQPPKRLIQQPKKTRSQQLQRHIFSTTRPRGKSGV